MPAAPRLTVKESKPPTIPDAILEVATKLFWQQGFAATSTRQIAAAAGMRQASLYYHVSCKEDLIYFIFVSSLSELTASVERELAHEQEPLERVRRLISAHLEALIRYQMRNSVVLTEILLITGTRRTEIRALRERYHQLVCTVIANAQAAGRIRQDIAAEPLALVLLNLLNWTSLWFQPKGKVPVGALADQFAQIFLDGAATRQGRKRPFHALAPPGRKRQLPPGAGPTQQRLHDIAAGLFARNGYQVTSMREIAEVLGVRKASLYYHVSSKEDLLFAIATEALEMITADVKSAIAEIVNPLDRVAALIQAHVMSLVTHREMHMAGRSGMRALSPPRRATVQAMRDAHEHLVSEILAAAAVSGDIRTDIDLKILRLALLSMMNRSEIWYRPGGALTAERISLLIARVFLQGAAYGAETPD